MDGPIAFPKPTMQICPQTSSLAFLSASPCALRVSAYSGNRPIINLRACSSSPGSAAGVSEASKAAPAPERLGVSVALFRPSPVPPTASSERGSVLLIRRSKPPYEGAWSLPGGSVEANESLRDAALRELREECALCERDGVRLALAHAEVLYLSRFAIHIFPAVLLGDAQPRAGDDAADARFFSLDELTELESTPNLPRVVSRIHERLGEFNLDKSESETQTENAR